MITSMGSRYLVLACLILVGCGAPTAQNGAAAGPAAPAASATPAAAPATPAAAPEPPLQETPADRLGSAPSGLGLEVGTTAPDATLTDLTGKPQRLGALYASGPVFVVFYRGGWCPFCNLQLHRLAQATPKFTEKGIKLVAISVDVPGEEAKTQAKQGVPFPMLSDSDLTVHKAFHVVHVSPDAEAKALASYGIELEKYSGQPHHSYAVPAIFLIDRSGKIRWRHIEEDYKVRPTPAQMLEVAEHTLEH